MDATCRARRTSRSGSVSTPPTPHFSGARRAPFGLLDDSGPGSIPMRIPSPRSRRGTGRDTRFLASREFRVQAFDSSAIAVRFSQKMATEPTRVRKGEALEVVRSQPNGRWDVVYANLVYNLDFTSEELRVLFSKHRPSAASRRPAYLHGPIGPGTVDLPWHVAFRGPTGLGPGGTHPALFLLGTDRTARSAFDGCPPVDDPLGTGRRFLLPGEICFRSAGRSRFEPCQDDETTKTLR